MSSRRMRLCILVALSVGCRRSVEDDAIVATGHVEATQVRVASKVGGTLAVLAVAEGDRVQAEQELARIDTTDLQLALAAARAEAEQAGAQLRLRLAGSRPEEIAEAEAQVRRAAADLQGAGKDLERMQGLLSAGSGTQKAQDDARTRHDVAAAALDVARETLARLRAGSRPQEVDAARAQESAARARMAQLEQQLHDTTIRSPVAGLVSEKVAERGEQVRPGATLLVVTDLSDAWLTAYVAETDLGRLRLGQEAEVVTDDGQRRSGKLAFVASQAEFTPKNVQTRDERVKLVYRIKVALDNGDGLFKPGMPAEARIKAAPVAR